MQYLTVSNAEGSITECRSPLRQGQAFHSCIRIFVGGLGVAKSCYKLESVSTGPTV
jgi:hypothetical protein